MNSFQILSRNIHSCTLTTTELLLPCGLRVVYESESALTPSLSFGGSIVFATQY